MISFSRRRLHIRLHGPRAFFFNQFCNHLRKEKFTFQCRSKSISLFSTAEMAGIARHWQRAAAARRIHDLLEWVEHRDSGDSSSETYVTSSVTHSDANNLLKNGFGAASSSMNRTDWGAALTHMLQNTPFSHSNILEKVLIVYGAQSALSTLRDLSGGDISTLLSRWYRWFHQNYLPSLSFFYVETTLAVRSSPLLPSVDASIALSFMTLCEIIYYLMYLISASILHAHSEQLMMSEGNLKMILDVRAAGVTALHYRMGRHAGVTTLPEWVAKVEEDWDHRMDSWVSRLGVHFKDFILDNSSSSVSKLMEEFLLRPSDFVGESSTSIYNPLGCRLMNAKEQETVDLMHARLSMVGMSGI